LGRGGVEVEVEVEAEAEALLFEVGAVMAVEVIGVLIPDDAER
jgi:hypothetical protein